MVADKDIQFLKKPVTIQKVIQLIKKYLGGLLHSPAITGNKTEQYFAANSGSSLTINPANGRYQKITLTNNCTITMAALPVSDRETEIIVEFLQDATGGRVITWAASPPVINGATGVAVSTTSPALNLDIAASSYFSIVGTSANYKLYGANQNLGKIDGSFAPAGYIGEVVEATNISAVSLVSNTAKTIKSITLTPGNWDIQATVNLNAASGTVISRYRAGFSASTDTLPTPLDGGYVEDKATQDAQAFLCFPIGLVSRLRITSTTTFYLVAASNFASGSVAANGKIKAVRAAEF